tara:strand:+ start:12386 stop:12751 length:366 start_codon:yes stop_codon:yes gene_type:complete
VKKTKIKILAISLFVFLLAFLSFRPIINPKMEDCEIVEGQLVEPFFSSKNKDLYFKIKGSPKLFRINRALEYGFSTSLMDSLQNQEVKIFPVKHWTLIDPYNNYPHVARLEWQGRLIYSEF